MALTPTAAAMCGRTTLTITPEELERTFGYEVPADYRISYNVAPSEKLLSIGHFEDGAAFQCVEWGWPDGPGGRRLINARSETLFSRPSFRDAARQHRCLVVADGYFEWLRGAGGARPFRFCRQDREAFTLAGVWQSHGANARCVIVTTSANDLNEPIHSRMPAVIAEGDREGWLGEENLDRLRRMIEPAPMPQWECYEVSTAVNSASVDGPVCIEPVEGPEQLSFGGLG